MLFKPSAEKFCPESFLHTVYHNPNPINLSQKNPADALLFLAAAKNGLMALPGKGF
jgi:hypothetical protein